MLALILLTLVCILTYSFEIVFALAGTILMLPLMSAFYDTKTLVIYSVLPQILVALIGLARARVAISLRFLAWMLGFAGIGAIAGFALFYYFSADVFQLLLASAITATGLFLVASPRRAQLGRGAARVLDILSGVSQALFGISGPIAMTRLLATFETKAEVRHYAFAFFLAMNLLRAVEYLVHGTYTDEILEMMLFSGPFLAITLWFSNQLHLRVREHGFRRGVAWAILGGGITLFFH
jgi:uncharacterized membrane protein YfcA